MTPDLAILPALMAGFADLDRIISEAEHAPSKGYIFLQAASAATSTDAGPLCVAPPSPSQRTPCHLGGLTTSRCGIMTSYDDVWPFVPAHLASATYREFPSFDRAVDDFFSRIEGQKIDMKAAAQVL